MRLRSKQFDIYGLTIHLATTLDEWTQIRTNTLVGSDMADEPDSLGCAQFMVDTHDNNAIAKSAVAAHDITLTANEAETFQFASNGPRGYFTTDNSKPALSGANCYPLPPLPSVFIVDLPGDLDTIKIISSGTPTVTVSRV